MKKFLSIQLIIVFSFLSVYAFAQNGAIKGKVLDENHLGMPGGVIVIHSLNKGAVTDEKGDFEFLNIPEGDYSLDISFMGYEDISQPVQVEMGKTATVRVDLKPGVLVGKELMILGDRLKGQAKAMNQQKNNANITNIVASDQIGRFPDANIGDALKRVPGITIQNDQGEARDIIVRGLAPQLNSVTLNGERIPSAEGDNRKVQLDLIPSDMIQLIEVSKALTPDMDADAIGGSVNLVTRSVPNGLRISGTLASGYNFLSEKPICTGSLIAGDRFFNNKLGAILRASYNYHDFGSDNVEAEWVDHEDFGPMMDAYELRTYVVKRVRRSISLGLDYQVSPNSTLYLNGMYNWRDDWENRFRFTVEDLEDAADDGNYAEVEEGIFEALATTTRQTKGGIDNSRVKSARLEDQRTMNFSLRGDHLLVNKIKMNWSGTYSRASEQRPNERYLTYEGGDVPVRIDLRNTRKPIITTLTESSWQEMEFDELTEERGDTWEEDLNGKLDLQLPAGNLGVIKIGGTYRSKTKKRANNFFEYAPIGGNADGDSHPDFGGNWSSDEEEYGDLLLEEVPTADKTKSDFLAGAKYKAGNFASNDFLGGLNLKNSALYEEEDKPDEYAPGNFTAGEDIVAGYIMADFQLSDRLSTIFGVRIENTQLDYKGFAYNDDEETIENTEGTNSFTNALPGVHFKFDATENTIIRLAWTNTLARPDYYRLVPFEYFEDDELEIGNPDLKTAVSMNFDLMAENYFKSIGLISAGAFYKNIDDFIYEKETDDYIDPTYSDGPIELTTFDNGGTAKVYGFEFAFQRQLDFLPGALRGLGVYLNYTNTNSETTGIEGREDEDISLPGTAKHMYNLSLSYETQRLVVRASLNHASDYIDELGGDSFEDRYYDKQTFLDLNASYAFTPNWRIFAELNNITNQPLRYYQGVSDRTMQMEYYNMRMNFGVKFDFFGE